jgi:N-methylhydantoinase B
LGLTSGGGGYGDPLDRDPKLVQKDVQDRLVSIELAEEIYGVILDRESLQVDLRKTEKYREKVRKLRLKGETKKARMLPKAKVVLQFHEYLEIVEHEGEKFIRCKKCSSILCSATQNYKTGAIQREVPPIKVTPYSVNTEEFVARQYYCPGCATLLSTDVVRSDEPILWDLQPKV